jgi:hypothetical protein
MMLASDTQQLAADEAVERYRGEASAGTPRKSARAVRGTAFHQNRQVNAMRRARPG